MYSIKLDTQSKYILRRLLNLPNPVQKAIRESFDTWGKELVRNTENTILNTPKYGRWYPSGNITKLPRDKHRASAPKQTPAFYKGKYFKGLGYVSSGTELEFGNTVKYASYLEEGTSKMEERPGLKNSIEATQRNFRIYYDASLRRNLR